MQLPVYEDVVAAGEFIRPHLPPTPLVYNWPLSQLLGCQYHFKAENFQPTGAFKVRGGVNLVGRLSPEEKRGGVISASTGNHGQSLAFAGGIFDVPVLIYGPAKNPNAAKVEAMRRLGPRCACTAGILTRPGRRSSGWPGPRGGATCTRPTSLC